MNISSHNTPCTQDRNFDDIADHFANKIYGGLKGRIRLAVLNQDLTTVIDELSNKLQRPLKILDVGAGMAQISLSLADKHHCTINDISQNMLDKAQEYAKQLNISHNTRFICCPYQSLPAHLTDEKFDLILCHAVLEWLGEPSQIMDFFDEFLNNDDKACGMLSLCFYNPSSLIYRNLVMGNFNQINQPKAADNKSLTPNNPTDPDDVKHWLTEHQYRIVSFSGIRVFSDYAPLKRGGLNNPDAIIEMELRYAKQAPFCHMGRYIHIIASR